MKTQRSLVARRSAHTLFAAALAAAATFAVLPQQASAAEPIRIGVIAEQEIPIGQGITNAAELAADEINAAGGIDGRQVELLKYDDHASAAEGVRAFQKAAKDDHVVAVVGSFLSEVNLALMPWAARLHMPYIGGGASNKIAETVHGDYKRYKYVFEQSNNSYYLARIACDTANYALVKPYGFKTAVILDEDAAWTKPLDKAYEECLPKAGLRIVGHIRYAPGTTDFSPIYSKIEAMHAQVIMAGMAHTGLTPTVQWHDQRVPAILAGINVQGGSSDFWSKTNGATEGMITWNTGVTGAALTPRTVPFQEAYAKRFNTVPTLEAYMTYDSMYALKQAIERAHSTKPDALVAALEKTDLVGTMGHVEFYGPKDRFTHDVKYGADLVSGVGFQWQDGKQVAIWPPHVATGKAILPDFVKAPHG